MQQKFYRQGDVFIRQIASIPKGKRKIRKDATLAYGEVTGHSHRVAVEDRAAATVFDCGNGMFMQVKGDAIRIVHEEHGTIILPPGNYAVEIQREYSPAEIRNVID